MPNITRTFLRTEATMTTYMETMKERERNGIMTDGFLDLEETTLKEFNHWLIIQNAFPYDAIATVSHILVTKRKIPFDWKLLTKEEFEEYKTLHNGYLSENYDAVYENLPKAKTVPSHFHLNLLVLKREIV